MLHTQHMQPPLSPLSSSTALQRIHKPSSPKASRTCRRQCPPKHPPDLFVVWLPDSGRKGSTAGVLMLALASLHLPLHLLALCGQELLDPLVQHRYQESTNTNPLLNTWQAFM